MIAHYSVYAAGGGSLPSRCHMSRDG